MSSSVIGTTVGSYRITGKLGEGGMGAVFYAEHCLMGSRAAVKVLLDEFSTDKEVVDRFFNEAKAATMIRHPSIIKIFDFGYSEAGAAYIVMELLEGDTLTERMKAGRMREQEVVRLIRQAARGLGAAHAAGIVHRDLKPDNFMLVHDPEVSGGERVKLLDFGIAKLTVSSGAAVKTRVGATMGTPIYMSPEQCRGRPDVDHRADIYALGCVMYHMICGRPPFGSVDSTDLMAILGQQVYEAPPPPHTINPEISAQMQRVIMRALEKEPEKRYQTMRQMVDELDGASAGRFQTSPGLALPAPLEQTGEFDRTSETSAETTGPSEFAAAGPATSTTLGNSAAELASPGSVVMPRARRTWIAAAAAVAVVASALGIVALRGGGDSTSSAAAAQPASSQSVARAQAEVPPAQPVEPPAERELGVPNTEVIEMRPSVRIELQSEPDGAAVYRAVDGIRIGRTPFVTDLEQDDGDLVVILKRNGYRDEKVELSLREDNSQTITLTKRPRPRGRPGKSGKSDRQWGDLID